MSASPIAAAATNRRVGAAAVPQPAPRAASNFIAASNITNSSTTAPANPSSIPSSSATATANRPRRPSRRIAPGLEARLQKLEQQNRLRERARQDSSTVGRIPEEQIAHIERLQRENAAAQLRRERTLRTRPAPQDMPARGGGVRLSGGPVLTDNETSHFESDVSSIIDISDHLAVSDTDEDSQLLLLHDTNKYRLPDVGKTRLNLHTKEPLSPSRVTSTQQQIDIPPPTPPHHRVDSPTPSTPRTNRSTITNTFSPTKMDHPSPLSHHSRNLSDYDFGRSLSRAGSIYTLSRATFAGQLAQLTSIRLPDASQLSRKISSIPTSVEAAKALSDAYEQIGVWISKASDVLEGLNAEDDVDWAAAGGREGIDEVDDAIGRFETLVDVYMSSIEELHRRQDFNTLTPDELHTVVQQMDDVVTSWKKIKDTLKGVKEQVDLAMEWEKLWNTVLGEIAQELEALHRLVFEMEEKRHQGAESLMSLKDSIDISDLETIVEENAGGGNALLNRRSRESLQIPTIPLQSSPRLSVTSHNAGSPVQAPSPVQDNKDDANLIGLYARMQPLRAALDFLPVKLSAFEARGQMIFPSACSDLSNRREQLEAQWTALDSDAGSLRRELGEDRWILVFRNAGRQALKMCESVSRSLNKLRENLEAGVQQSDLASLTKKVESYEAKKIHYGPAIERVIAIVDRGVLDRLTVNGEILRLQDDMRRQWTSLQAEICAMDSTVEELETQDKQLRESVSTVLSSERSMGSVLFDVDTPGSSPASSLAANSRKNSFQGSRTPTSLTSSKVRPNSTSVIPVRLTLTGSVPRKQQNYRASAADIYTTATAAGSPASSRTTPSRPTGSSTPRWTSSIKPGPRDFRPLAAFEPSPYAKAPVTPKSSFLRASSASASTPPSALPRPASVLNTSRKTSLPAQAPSSSTRALLAVTSTSSAVPRSTLSSKASAPSLRTTSRLSGHTAGAATGRRSTVPPTLTHVEDGNDADTESPAHHHASRPQSRLSAAAAHSSRSKLLANAPPVPPLPRKIPPGEATSSTGVKPRWRF